MPTFIRNWITIFAVLLVGAIASLSYNSITSDWSFLDGLQSLGGQFGGLASLGSLLLVVMAIMATIALGRFVASHHFTGGQANAIGVVFVIILAVVAWVGFRWINIGSDLWPTLWVIVGAVVIVTVATLIVTHRDGGSSTTTPTPATTP